MGSRWARGHHSLLLGGSEVQGQNGKATSSSPHLSRVSQSQTLWQESKCGYPPASGDRRGPETLLVGPAGSRLLHLRNELCSHLGGSFGG